jgi:hypothetical protein
MPAKKRAGQSDLPSWFAFAKGRTKEPFVLDIPLKPNTKELEEIS